MKQKTHKSASKRIKVTKRGKYLKARVQTSHLKEKNTSGRKYRQKRLSASSKGYVKKLKKLLNT